MGQVSAPGGTCRHDVERDGSARDRRPTAPDRGEPIDGQPGDDPNRNQIDDAEHDDAAASGQEKCSADGNYVENDDDALRG